METNKRLRRADKRDKRERFSIRKFNVGVASVAVAAFWGSLSTVVGCPI